MGKKKSAFVYTIEEDLVDVDKDIATLEFWRKAVKDSPAPIELALSEYSVHVGARWVSKSPNPYLKYGSYNKALLLAWFDKQLMWEHKYRKGLVKKLEKQKAESRDKAESGDSAMVMLDSTNKCWVKVDRAKPKTNRKKA